MIHSQQHRTDESIHTVRSPDLVERYSTSLQKVVTIEFERIAGCFYGLAVGDARGLPFETLKPEQIAAVLDEGTRPFYPLSSNSYLRDTACEPGQVSDDLHLSLAVMKALVEGVQQDGSISMDVLGTYHVDVLTRGAIGWGPSTRTAVEAFANGTPWHEAGQVNAAPDKGLGNGIPMKIAAIGLYAALVDLKQETFDQIICNIARMSHPKSMAVSAGIAHAEAIRYCLSVNPDEFSRDEFIQTVIRASKRGEQFFHNTKSGDDITARLAECRNWEHYSELKIRESFGSGACYVYHSLPFSYMFFLQNPHSFDTVEKTIRAGGDTDSNAALVGALIGALHGTRIVPQAMQAGLRGTADLQSTLDIFWRRFAAG
jgi:ADP-ribosylglycohydrolase